ncbi:MAG: hypothetical protein AAGF06_04170 [Pseudomonadota bacterium]
MPDYSAADEQTGDTMKFFFILLLLSFLLLPILKLRPRSAQKRMMALRATAAEHKLLVQYAATPNQHALFNPSMSIRYQLNFDNDELERFSNTPLLQWNRTVHADADQTWELVQYKQVSASETPWHARLQAILATLPDVFNAVELTSSYAGAYWDESGQPEDVAQLNVTLHQLKEIIESAPLKPL